jgi:hypothetical protein
MKCSQASVTRPLKMHHHNLLHCCCTLEAATSRGLNAQQILRFCMSLAVCALPELALHLHSEVCAAHMQIALAL